jgi:hypothetical protein
MQHEGIARAFIPLVSRKRAARRIGYGRSAAGEKPSAHRVSVPDKENHLPALLLVLLLIVILFVLGFAVVKFLIWIAIIVAIVWLIGFFVRGVEGARWYRW